MGPRADFACLSKKCQQDGAASVYELPVAATRCPVCGSKRLQRLYNAINVSSGIARRTDAIAGPAYEQAVAGKNAARDSRRHVAPPIAVPVNGIGAALGKLHPAFSGVGFAGGKGVASSAPPPLPGPVLRKLPPRPNANSLRDRDFRINVKKDAKGQFVNAEVARA